MKISELRDMIRSVLKEEMGCHDEEELDEVTPPGFEKVVKGLKKNPEVDNPWAVANAMKNKGIKPHRNKRKK